MPLSLKDGDPIPGSLLYRDFMVSQEIETGVNLWDLEDAQEDSLIGDLVKNYGYPTSRLRPDFGANQVRDMGEIRKGKRFGAYNLVKGTSEEIVITSDPYKEDGEWMVRVEGSIGGRPRAEVYLSGQSIVPNRNGLWNCWNCLLKPQPQ